MKVFGLEMELVKIIYHEENVHEEIYEGKKGVAIRWVDKDADEVISLTKYPNLDALWQRRTTRGRGCISR